MMEIRVLRFIDFVSWTKESFLGDYNQFPDLNLVLVFGPAFTNVREKNYKNRDKIRQKLSSYNILAASVPLTNQYQKTKTHKPPNLAFKAYTT